MSFCHIERQATRVPCTPSCLGAWPSWLIILTTTLTRVPVWVNLGLQRGSQPEGMRLDEFPKGWLYNRQIPLEGHVPMASWSKWGAPLWESKITALQAVVECVILRDFKAA